MELLISAIISLFYKQLFEVWKITQFNFIAS